MVKEGGTKELEVGKESKKPRTKQKWRNFLIIFLVIILFLVLAWFLLGSFRQSYSNYLIDQAKNTNDQKQKVIDLYKARIMTPMSSAPYFELGKLAYNNQKYDLAQKDFTTALKFNDKDTQTYFYVINTLINQGKNLEVNSYFDKLTLIDPNNPEIVFLKARLVLSSDQADKAKELLATIKDRDIKYETYYTLILLSEGKFAIIDKSSDAELNSLVAEISTSQNPIFIKARLGLEWLKLGEKDFGCNLIKEAKNKNNTITQKLNTYQKLFNTCNL